MKIKKRNLKIFILVLFGFFLIGVGIFIYNPFKKMENQLKSESGEIVAKVDGENIYRKDVEDVKKIALSIFGQSIPEKIALDTLISEKIVEKEIEKRKITVSDLEAERKIEETALLMGKKIEDIKKEAILRNVSYSQILENYKKQIKLEKLIHEIMVEKNVEKISDDKIKEFYEKNKEMFLNASGEPIEYEKLSAKIGEYLEVELRRKVIANYIEELKKEKNIEILDALYLQAPSSQ